MRLQQLTIQVDSPKDGLPWLKRFYEVIRDVYAKMVGVVNGSIGFGDGTNADNIDGVWVNTVTAVVNFTVNHNLNRIPVGWIMVNTDAFENLKFVSSTKTQITLVGQNGGANVRLFII